MDPSDSACSQSDHCLACCLPPPFRIYRLNDLSNGIQWASRRSLTSPESHIMLHASCGSTHSVTSWVRRDDEACFGPRDVKHSECPLTWHPTASVCFTGFLFLCSGILGKVLISVKPPLDAEWLQIPRPLIACVRLTSTNLCSMESLSPGGCSSLQHVFACPDYYSLAHQVEAKRSHVLSPPVQWTKLHSARKSSSEVPLRHTTDYHEELVSRTRSIA